MATNKLLKGLLLAVVLASQWCYALDANEESVTQAPSGQFDFLVYALTWQPTFCLLNPTNEGCRSLRPEFYTHGIWPYYKSDARFTNRHPAYCVASPGCRQEQAACDIEPAVLAESLADPLLARFITPHAEKLLSHEWKKHGTCYGQTQRQYFTDFVNLRAQARIDNAYAHYIGKSLRQDELRALFPQHTAFRCVTLGDRQYLFEVFFLVTRAGLPYKEEIRLQIGEACTAPTIHIPSSMQRPPVPKAEL